MPQKPPEADDGPLLFDPRTPEFRRDPHVYYRQLREKSPVYRNPLGGWLVTRYADCTKLLEDSRLRGIDAIRCFPDEAIAGRQDIPVNSDFVRFRKTVARALAPAVLERFRPRIQQIVDEALDTAIETGDVNLVDAFAYPLAATVFCELLGVPVSDRVKFRGWVDTISEIIDVFVVASAEMAEQHRQAQSEFTDYFRGAIAERRHEPRDDLLNALLAIEQDGAALTEDDVLTTCVTLLTAGHQTTVQFLTGAVYALLSHPRELRRFRDDPGISSTAIEELMRYASPVTLTVRSAATAIDVSGQRIPAGEYVVPVLAAANRDPEIFADPERLDLTRARNPHLAFGHGARACLGASLARLEGQIALSTLIRRAPEIALRGEPAYMSTIGLRAFSSLPVSLR